jgi:hypothetical protein
MVGRESSRTTTRRPRPLVSHRHAGYRHGWIRAGLQGSGKAQARSVLFPLSTTIVVLYRCGAGRCGCSREGMPVTDVRQRMTCADHGPVWVVAPLMYRCGQRLRLSGRKGRSLGGWPMIHRTQWCDRAARARWDGVRAAMAGRSASPEPGARDCETGDGGPVGWCHAAVDRRRTGYHGARGGPPVRDNWPSHWRAVVGGVRPLLARTGGSLSEPLL